MSMRSNLVALALALLLSQPAFADGIINPGSSSGGGAPSGPAGGVLSGTYPNPGYAVQPLVPANNLSDLANATTARTNLGLGGLATVTPGTGVATALGNPAGGTGGFALQNDARFPTGSWPTTTTNNDFLTFNGTGGAPQDSGTSWANPAALGTGTPNTGAFTSISVTSSGNVANLNASSLNGATFANPGAIGSGTAAISLTVSGPTTLTGPSLTGSQTTSPFTLAQTRNTSGNAAGVTWTFTDIAVGASANLFQIFGGAAGTTSEFRVDRVGDLVIAGGLQATSGQATVGVGGFVINGRSYFSSLADAAVVFSNNAGTQQDILSFPTSATWQFGAADAASPVPQQLQVQSVAAGNANVAAVAWTRRGSLSNGSGCGGDIIEQTTLGTAASGTQNISANVVIYKACTQFAAFAKEVTIGSSTPAAGQGGDLAQIKETDAGAAPGAGYATLKWVAGSGTSCNLIAYAGVSLTPVTIASTVGSGC
jgi:hypothetical protein